MEAICVCGIGRLDPCQIKDQMYEMILEAIADSNMKGCVKQACTAAVGSHRSAEDAKFRALDREARRVMDARMEAKGRSLKFDTT